MEETTEGTEREVIKSVIKQLIMKEKGEEIWKHYHLNFLTIQSKQEFSSNLSYLFQLLNLYTLVVLLFYQESQEGAADELGFNYQGSTIKNKRLSFGNLYLLIRKSQGCVWVQVFCAFMFNTRLGSSKVVFSSHKVTRKENINNIFRNLHIF